MFKAVILVTLVAVANCALLPTFAPRNQFYQPQRNVFVQPQQYYQQGAEAGAQILRSESVVNPDSFQYAYETSNGIAANEQGQLKQIGRDAAIATQGSFAWTSPEGVPVQVSYIADENGYQPASSLLPTPPPVPAAIARAVEYLKRVNPQPQVQQPFFQRF